MISTSTLIMGVIFGAIIPLFCGIALMILPYFIPNIYILILSGIIIVAIPYFIRI